MFCTGVVLTFIPFSFFGKVALEWFIIGAAIVKMQIHTTFLDNISMRKVFGVYFVLAIFALFLNVSAVKNIFIFVGIAFWMRVSKDIYTKEAIRKKVLWLSQWTFMVYVFHELTLSSLQKLCVRMLPTTSLFLLCEYLLLPVFVTISCIIIGVMLRKFAPKVYLFSTGER